MSAFKVGDKVKALGGIYTSWIGEVTFVAGESLFMYEVSFNEAAYRGRFRADELEHVPEVSDGQ